MINPIGMTVTDWSDSVILSIGDVWSFGRLDDEARWQDWAVGLVRAFSPRSLPNPYEFDNWQEWAMRAYSMLETVTT